MKIRIFFTSLILFCCFIFINTVFARNNHLRAVISDDYPNDYESAIEIPFNKKVSGSHEVDNDEDWFYFEVDVLDGFNLTGVVLSDKIMRGVSVYVYDEFLETIQGGSFYSAQENIFSFNLDPGKYYIKILDDIGYKLRYEFTLESAENTNDAISLDPDTLAYCRSDPEACGITSEECEQDFTQADLNDEYDKGYDEAVAYCRANPEECGITVEECDECVQDYTLADLNDEYDRGYERGYEDGTDACTDSTADLDEYDGDVCAVLQTDFSFTIPCVDVYGTRLEVPFVRFVNTNDPFGLYWELGF